MGRLSIVALLFWAYAAAALLNGWSSQAIQPADTLYQQRAQRFEGVKPGLASGYDIELLSAVVDFREQRRGLGERAEIRFVVPADASVGSVTVRELHTRYHYWLDRVEPNGGWQRGRENAFTWPLGDVLRRLDGFETIYGLGVVVRLNNAQPRPVEEVAPAILSYGERPSSIRRYAFAVRTGGPAALKAYAVTADARSLLQEFASVPPAEAVWIPWTRRQDEQPGWRTLYVEGYFLDSNDSIRKTIRFFDGV